MPSPGWATTVNGHVPVCLPGAVHGKMTSRGQDVNGVGGQTGISGDEREAFHEGLGHQHSIEGVVVVARQGAGGLSVLEAYWQLVEPRLRDGGAQGGGRLQLFELPLD